MFIAGSAVDALIASLICVGALNLQSTGIGGGGFMVVYNRKYKKAEAFDYRETGPANMTEDMYNYDKTSNLVGKIFSDKCKPGISKKNATLFYSHKIHNQQG